MMDPEAIANGQSSTAVNEMTPAQRLQGKHNVDMAHPVIVGGVEDTKDAVHPPSSKQSESDSLSLPVRVPMGEPISEKAAGKQKESSLSGASPGNKVQVLPAALDTRSEEAFPALKAGPKPQPSNPISMAWGSKKPASVGYAQPNGVDKDGPMAVDNPSRASTPASGILTPDPANLSAAQSRGIPMPRIPLPGRHSEHSERIQFSPSQLLPRDQLKRPLQDLIRAINKRSKATVQLKPGPNKTIFFEATGPPSATRQALIDVAREAGSKV